MADVVWDDEAQPAGASPDVVWDEAPQAEATAKDKIRATGRGFIQGATSGFADEIGGGIQANLQDLANNLPKGSLEWAGIDNRYEQDPTDTYRAGRQGERMADAEAKAKAPEFYNGANIAGGVAQSAALTALGAPVGWGSSSLQGAVAGLGNSEADLTRGEYGKAAVDTGAGALIGAGAHGLGTLAGKVLQKPAEWAGRAVGRARGQVQGMATEAIDEGIRSAKGALGGEVQKGSRFLENIDRGVATGRISPEQAQVLAQLDETGALDELAQGVLGNNLAELPGQLGVIGAKRADFLGRVANRDNAIAGMAQGLEEGAGKAIWGAALGAGEKATAASVLGKLAAGGAEIVGGVAGGPMGWAAGKMFGSGLQAAAGAASTPQGRIYLAKAAQGLLEEPAALGRFAAPLMEAAGRSEGMFQLAHDVYMKDPEYRRLLGIEEG